MTEVQQYMSNSGMTTGNGSPYIYLVYKTAKNSWKPIAGVSSRGPVPRLLLGVPSTLLPRHPTHVLQSLQVQQLSQVMKTLKLKSQNGQLQGKGGAYWIIESPQEFAVFVRTHQRELANSPLATYDFKDMYTALPHALIPSSLAKALEEAWVYEAERRLCSQSALFLDGGNWSVKAGMPMRQVLAHLHWVLHHCYVFNDGVARHQVQGLPMGLGPAPQIANLTCYVAERVFVTSGERTLACRYIDDIFAAGKIPTPGDYGIQYSKTSTNDDEVVYLGIRVYKQAGTVRTTTYDREETYPFHILRYPHAATVASQQQLVGVLMRRFVAAMYICSTLSDFKQSVYWILRRAVERKYSYRFCRSVWSKFLFQR